MERTEIKVFFCKIVGIQIFLVEFLLTPKDKGVVSHTYRKVSCNESCVNLFFMDLFVFSIRFLYSVDRLWVRSCKEKRTFINIAVTLLLGNSLKLWFIFLHFLWIIDILKLASNKENRSARKHVVKLVKNNYWHIDFFITKGFWLQLVQEEGYPQRSPFCKSDSSFSERSIEPDTFDETHVYSSWYS